MAELAEQEIEGVKFTPKASLDIDKIDSEKSAGDGGAGAGDGEGSGEGVTGDSAAAAAATNVAAGDSSSAAAGEKKKDESPNGGSDNNDDSVDLNDIVVSIGDKETPVSEVIKEYQVLSKRVEEIEKDEFLKNFVEHYLAGGDPGDYLQSKSDPSKVDDLSLMRERFFSDPDNKGFDDDVKEALFEKELSEKYGMNPDGSFDDADSKAAKIGKQTMKRDADKVRAERLERQKKFEIKRRESPKQEQAKVNPEEQLKAISEVPSVKDFLAKKSVVLEDGVALPVEKPEEVVGMMADLNKFWAKFKDPKGNVDWSRVTRLMAFASDPAKYDRHLLSTGGDRATEAYLKEQKNIGGREQKVIDKSLDVDGLDLSNDVEKENFLKQALAQKNKGRR